MKILVIVVVGITLCMGCQSEKTQKIEKFRVFFLSCFRDIQEEPLVYLP